MDDEMNYNCNNSQFLSGSIHSSDSGSNLLDEPLNGIANKQSAAMLASEIDLLVESESKGDHCEETNKPTSLDLPETVETSLNEGDWNLLDCYFGIPLFEQSINKEICDRVISQKLFHTNR